MKVFFGTLTLLLLNVFCLFAQPGEPCGGTDPDAVCPLDTWVFVLAAAALLFTTLHLYRKQKRALIN
ncbi:hypothetical protein BH09BAC6_BH09BAC6_13880 [soil metagenome]